MSIILGIDPGTVCTGYGAIRKQTRRLTLVECGVIRPARGLALPARLARIYAGVDELIRRLEPESMAVEDTFFARNPRSALKLGQARGVALVAGVNRGVPVHEYPPAEVKLAVTGYGRAEKTQVAFMISRILGADLERVARDATDALAVAVCHAGARQMRQRLERAG